jgi:hypothetical protein
MTKYLTLIALALLAFAQKPTQAQFETINAKDLKKHLTFIASDELKGRDTGSPELEIAAKYLSAHLESFGYKGLGENGSFLQPVPMYKTKYSNEGTYLEINGEKMPYKIGEDVSIYSYGDESLTIEGELVSVGYGIAKDKSTIYKADDVAGKVALRFNLDESYGDLGKTDQAFTHQNIRNAIFDAKAVAVVNVVSDETAARMIPLYARYAQGLRMNLAKEENPRVYVLINPAFYAKLLKKIKVKSFDKNTVASTKAKIKIHVPATSSQIETHNVVGYLEGTDKNLKSEYVGYGAHYDHVGVNADGSINNGADDDGSGTVSVLKIAEAIALNPPKRSTFIIFHTGEEKGLLGSEYYSEHPLLPLEKMVAMINIDMIGSYYKPDTVDVVGADRISQELHDINEASNKSLDNLYLEYKYNAVDHPERIYYRSDHYNYARFGVPVIFYTNDNPLHYHKPSDTVETINFAKMTKIARLALTTGMAVQNKVTRLKINDGFVPDKSK